jgi:hypothetical protein
LEYNAVEKLLQRPAVRREKHLFVGGMRGGHDAAVFNSLISSTTANRVEVAPKLVHRASMKARQQTKFDPLKSVPSQPHTTLIEAEAHFGCLSGPLADCHLQGVVGIKQLIAGEFARIPFDARQKKRAAVTIATATTSPPQRSTPERSHSIQIWL